MAFGTRSLYRRGMCYPYQGGAFANRLKALTENAAPNHTAFAATCR
jgi:uncharacterized membrane-anchored protein